MLDQEQPAPALDSTPPAGDTPIVDGQTLEGADDGLEDGLPDGQELTPEELEEELEGVKLRGPKEALERIKAERLMQADYTRKTQEVAEQRKTVEAEQQRFQQNVVLHQQAMQEIARVTAIDDRLQQFSQVNWAQLANDNPVQALQLQGEYQQLQAARGQLVNAITQKQQQVIAQQQQESAKRLQDAEAFVKREIKDWSPEKDRELESYAKTQGVDSRALSQFILTNPAILKLVDKAAQFDRLVKTRTAKPVQEQPKPVTRIGGAGANNKKPLSEMSDNEFIEARRKYIANHR